MEEPSGLISSVLAYFGKSDVNSLTDAHWMPFVLSWVLDKPNMLILE